MPTGRPPCSIQDTRPDTQTLLLPTSLEVIIEEEGPLPQCPQCGLFQQHVRILHQNALSHVRQIAFLVRSRKWQNRLHSQLEAHQSK